MHEQHQPSIFLLGKGDRDDPCHEILLRHGDVLIMDGDDRQALHAVPRVLDLSTANETIAGYSASLRIKNKKCLNYLRQARLNINIRQVSS